MINALRKPDFDYFLEKVLNFFKSITKLILVIFTLGILFSFSTLWYFSSDLPDYKILSNYKPPVSSRVHSGEGQLIAEYAMSLYTKSRKRIDGKYDVGDRNLRTIAFIAHFSGWVTMMTAYGIVWRQFALNIEKSKEYGVYPPDFVYAIVIGLFALYNIFGFSQFSQVLIKAECCCCKDSEDCCAWPSRCWRCYFTPIGGLIGRCKCDRRCRSCEKDRCCGKSSTNVAVESFFVWNSLISKTLLGWLLYANLLVRDSRGVSEFENCA